MIQKERPLPGGLFFETWIGDDSMETLREKIQKILEETVNLQLAAHNGSASLSDFADGVAWVRFNGACANCMSASETLEDVVKLSLIHIFADSLLGEVTPQMAAAVGSSPVRKILLPVNKCNNIIVGTADKSTSDLISEAIRRVQENC